MSNMFDPGYMTGFKTTEKPDVQTFKPEPPKPPTPPKKLSELEIEEEKKLTSKGRSKRSTVLTGPLGLLDQATVKRKTLLGA